MTNPLPQPGARSQLVEEPLRPFGTGADSLDAVAQLPVGSNHDDLTVVTDYKLPHHLVDDCVVP